jgi:SAM-dependent methyltransferase
VAFEWDETLYAGSARYYARGRMPYPHALADALRESLGLDGRGRLLDVGCGPASLTHLLAPLFAEAVGIDADAAMVREARRAAAANERFVQLRAEQLPAGLGTFDVVTFAQSFHWLDQARVAMTVHDMLVPSGAVVHVGATTHRGDGDVPHDEIEALVRTYLGPVRRAGRRTLPDGAPAWEDDVFAAAGYAGPERLDVPAGRTHERSVDDVVAAVFSLSSAAPHLFGDRRDEFERELRALLLRASPTGRFRERTRDIGVTIWRA